MATNVSFTRGPAYRIMSQAIKDGQLLIATDSRQLFIDQGYTRIEITDILVVDKLPENNVIVNKLYYVDRDNILAIFNGTQWIQINAQQLITTGSKKGTISVGGVDIVVNGLGTAAYASKDDFDPAGAAGAMIGSTDDSIDAHTILGIRNRVDKAVKDINNTINTEVTELDTKIDDATSTLNTKIDDTTSTLNTKMDDSISTINTNVENQITELNQVVQNEITNVNNTVDQKVNDLSSSIDTKLSTTNQYTIQKLTEVAENSVATYSLYKDGTPVGEKINIPKDYLVRYAELKICKKRDNPPGFETGDQYIDFAINSAEDNGNESHIYLNVSDLVDVYEAGNGIDVDRNNIISVNITPGNGFDFEDDKLHMSEVTTEVNGAMLATDKVKLDNIESGAQVNKIYTILKQRQPNLGYAATYILYEDNTIVGDPINIPEDYVVSNVAFAIGNGRVGRIEAGRPYLDITVQNYLQTSNEIHIYCELPMPGNGISIDENNIKVILKEENGIYFNDVGEIALDLVTQTSNGAMSAEDKKKLDAIEGESQVNIIESASLNGVSGTIDENKNVDLTFSVSDHGLSLGEDNEIGLKLVPGNGLEYNSTGQFGMQLVNSSKKTHGAISFSDKSKLDGIEDGSQVNDIEHIMLNGVEAPLTADTKTVDIPLTVNDQGLSIGDNNEIGLKLVPGNGLEYNSSGQFGLQLVTQTTRNGAMSMADKTKLDGIEEGSQVNDIEHIALNGVEAPLNAETKTIDIPLTVSNQGLSIGDNNEIGLKLVPGNGLEYNDKGQFALQVADIDKARNGAITYGEKDKLAKIENGSQVNIIESASLNGVTGTIDDNKNVNLTFSVSDQGLSLGDNNEIGLKLVPGNGIAFNSDGQFALSLAKPTKEGQAATNGALSGADKTKIMGQVDINAVAHPFQILSDTDESLTDVDKAYAADVATGAVKLAENKVLTMPASEGTSESGTDGYMTAAYAKKLEGIEAGSQVNIIESIQVGNTNATIANKKASIPLSVNATGLALGANNEISFKYVTGNGLAMNDNGQLGLSVVTQSANGAMLATDKTKIDNLKSIYTVDNPLSFNGTTLSIIAASGTDSGTAGYMTATQATKLEGIAAGAQVNVIESIQVGNTNATISDKKATIPLSVNASGLALGNNNEISLKYTPGNGLAMNDSGQLGLTLASQSEHGAMSSTDKTKLDNLKSIYTVDAPLVNDGTKLSIPAATASANGYMTSAYAKKLDGIETGAQVNIIESIQVGNTAATVTNKKASIPLSVNANGLALGNNNEISFKYVAGNGLAMNDDGSLGLEVVTTSANGAMISTDKTKLDNLKSIYTVNAPLSFSGTTLSIPAATTTAAGHMSANDKSKLDGLKNIKTVNAPLSFSGTTLSIPAATASANGYMTSTQAKKLDGMASGAQVNVIESIQVGNANATISGKKATIPLSVKADGLALGTNNEISFKYVVGNGLAMNDDGSLGLEVVTPKTNGAMLASDKTKLDSLKSIYTVNSPLSFSGNTLSIPAATASANGYMTSTYASKLNGIATGAEVNKIDSITFAGKAVSITNKQATIPFSVKQDGLSLGTNNEISLLYTPGNGLAMNTDHSLGMTLATPSANGAMSATDKAKLDGINTDGMAKKYSTVIGNGSSKSFTITHGLDQPHVIVSGFDSSGYSVWLNYRIISSTQVTVTFETAPATNGITIVVIG